MWPNQLALFKALVSCVAIIFVYETSSGVTPMSYSSWEKCVMRMGVEMGNFHFFWRGW